MGISTIIIKYKYYKNKKFRGKKYIKKNNLKAIIYLFVIKLSKKNS